MAWPSLLAKPSTNGENAIQLRGFKMMAKIYHDQDAELDFLKAKTIGVIGYGNQGRAQALNLRDSGLEVIIGVRADETHQQAISDGFDTFSIQEAAA
jgi:ketol-acid reductoisomerase